MLKKRTNVSKDEFMNAIPGSKGQLYPIEIKLNCTRKALRDLLKKFPDLEDELNDELARSIDQVVLSTFEDAVSGSEKEKTKSRELLLRAFAKDRGFGEVKDQANQNSINLFLHSPAKLPSTTEWIENAKKYKEKEDQAIEAEFRKLNI